MIALAEESGEPQVLKQIPNEPGRVLKELRKLGKGCELKVCYEAGPLGFGLQRELTLKKIDCIIVAPSLIPVRNGERIKTDRRDACKLAHFLRSGDLTPIWIPDEETEAIRDLERSREDARLAERTARQQLLKFLLRHDRKFTEGKSHWTGIHWTWIRKQRFEQPALNAVLEDYVQAEIATQVEDWVLAPLVKNLMAFLGVKLVTATAISAEIGNFKRFEKASSFMAFTGLVPTEHSSGGSRKQGGITKTGNRHVRRLLVEAAWHYYDARPGVSRDLQKRREGVPQEVVDIAEKARLRLRRKAARMRSGHKPPNKITTALARELAGFLWAAALATHCASAK
ncbi:UNVERIFIED_CONTAM: hypothetical protein GTU68_003219 [Idotea baltica]|nr:hypothetical protein [Idotea baltica]